MKAQTLLKTITVAGAVAATLSLSACDMHISFGQEGQGQEQDRRDAPAEENPEAVETEAAEQPATDTSQGSAADDTTSNGSASNGSTANGTSDSGSSASNGTSDNGGTTDSSSAASASDSGASNGTSTSTGTTDDGYQGPRIGEEGVELDQDGTGKIPADVLEKDIKHAYAKQGTTVDSVDCFADLRIYKGNGSQNCTVTTAGRKHYGTVKITSASQSGIGYSLEFPNI